MAVWWLKSHQIWICDGAPAWKLSCDSIFSAKNGNVAWDESCFFFKIHIDPPRAFPEIETLTFPGYNTEQLHIFKDSFIVKLMNLVLHLLENLYLPKKFSFWQEESQSWLKKRCQQKRENRSGLAYAFSTHISSLMLKHWLLLFVLERCILKHEQVKAIENLAYTTTWSIHLIIVTFSSFIMENQTFLQPDHRQIFLWL